MNKNLMNKKTNTNVDIIDDVKYDKPGIYYITYRISRTEKRTTNEEPEILAEAYLAVAVRGEK